MHQQTKMLLLQMLTAIFLTAALVVMGRTVRRQHNALQRMSTAMIQARAALHAQGDALDECMKSVFPQLEESPPDRESHPMTFDTKMADEVTML